MKTRRVVSEWVMNISSVGSSVNTGSVVGSTKQPSTPEQASARSKLVQAVKTVNESNALGDSNNEFTFAVDRETHKTVIRIINRETQDVVMQVPEEYLLRLAEGVKGNSEM